MLLRPSGLLVAAVMPVLPVLAACGARSSGDTTSVAGGDAERGAAAIARYGCGACHEIPGVRTADGLVGPPLDRWRRRIYIAGRLPNTPENMVQWVMQPQAFEPGGAMPNMGVREGDARDIAAYLYTLR